MIYAPIPDKRCSRCQDFKPGSSDYFDIRRRSWDGLNATCKTCRRPPKPPKPPQTSKICSICERDTPFAECAKDRHASYGVKTICRNCDKKKRHEDYMANRPAILAHQKQRREANPEKVKQQRKRYNDANINKRRQEARDHYNANKPARMETVRRWQKANPEKTAQYKKTWTRDHPELISLYLHRRESRKQSLPDTLTYEEWCAGQGYWASCCAICARPQGLWHTISPDHWIPLASVNCPGTVVENILPLCHAKSGGTGGCNNSKGHQDPVEWLYKQLGPRKAKAKLREIEAYFEWAKIQKHG